jgi:hypothetical protein
MVLLYILLISITLELMPGLEICEQFNIQPQQFVDKWEAYLDSSGAEGPPKMDHFEAIKIEIARKFKKGQEKDIQNNVQRGSRLGDFHFLRRQFSSSPRRLRLSCNPCFVQAR